MIAEDECEVFRAALAILERRVAVKHEARSKHGRQNKEDAHEQDAHRRA
jgi:hypothetical protein